MKKKLFSTLCADLCLCLNTKVGVHGMPPIKETLLIKENSCMIWNILYMQLELQMVG